MTPVALTHRFDADALASLPGPQWLVERRREALETFTAGELPTGAEEDWRYSRIGELDLSRFAPPSASPASGGLPSRAKALIETVGSRSGLAVSQDGVVSVLELDPALASAGVRLTRISDSPVTPVGLGERLAGRPDAFTRLAEAFLLDGIELEVPAGVRVPEPIVIVHAAGAASAGRALFPRALVRLGEAAEATVIELWCSDDEELLVVPVTELSIGDGAHATHLGLQELGAAAWQLGYQASAVGRSAVLRSYQAALGGEYARHWSRTELVGEGAESQLLAVYLGDGGQVEEFRTYQEHIAPRTRSELIFKGAVAGTAQSVYTGLIHMHPGAKKADASQTNRNLVLSEGARAYSVPNLDIEENDVRCSHASAVGPIDLDQRFYVESRGVPGPIAERLILLGFFEDLLARSPHPGVAAHLRAEVAERLIPVAGGR
ncbi:MAG: Fe-S cluster assembly protein SufD [Acidimicrobiaceae bacterium]|nr:Fe-S cluster assembly protein SufD [Acidimicrobiaceae bacterium]